MQQSAIPQGPHPVLPRGRTQFSRRSGVHDQVPEPVIDDHHLKERDTALVAGPVTGLAALATGRKDALFFVIGGFAGAFAFTLSYGWLKANTSLFDSILGGKVSLAETGSKYEHLMTMDGTMLGILLGLAFIGIAIAVPKSLR